MFDFNHHIWTLKKHMNRNKPIWAFLSIVQIILWLCSIKSFWTAKRITTVYWKIILHINPLHKHIMWWNEHYFGPHVNTVRPFGFSENHLKISMTLCPWLLRSGWSVLKQDMDLGFWICYMMLLKKPVGAATTHLHTIQLSRGVPCLKKGDTFFSQQRNCWCGL